MEDTGRPETASLTDCRTMRGPRLPRWVPFPSSSGVGLLCMSGVQNGGVASYFRAVMPS